MALISCRECGKQISDQAVACPNCGAPVASRVQPAAMPVIVAAPKSRSLAVLLAMLLGGIGLHKFYLNSPGLGVIYLFFCWTFIPAIIGFFEGLMYLFMSDQEFQRRYTMTYTEAVSHRYSQSDLTPHTVTQSPASVSNTDPVPSMLSVSPAYPVDVFRDDDAGYIAWLQQHPHGFVVDIYRHRPQSQMVLHHTTCATVQPIREGMTSGQFFKACCTDTTTLITWAALQGYKKDFVPCPQCRY